MAKRKKTQKNTPPCWNRVAIVGVGLIGGSIGLALRQRNLAKDVIGIGRRRASLSKAQRRGAITSATTDLAAGVAEADLVVVCTPIDTIVDQVQATSLACGEKTLITDAGSTKAEIVASLAKLPGQGHFVGSHPMAGSEQSGPEHADASLFVGRNVIVTPARTTNSQAKTSISAFWRSLGAEVLDMSPAEHDRRVAEISHLPHLVAAALAAATTDQSLPLASSGWLDTTRVAAGDPELWSQILSGNERHVLKSLDRFEKLAASLRIALEKGDTKRLMTILRKAKQKRDVVGN